MKKYAIAAVLAMLCVTGRAEAGLTYEFTFSYTNSSSDPSTLLQGSGVLFGTDNGDGSYTLTSGSGTSTEAGALTLEPAGTYINTLAPSVNLTSDNLLFPGLNPVLDGNGIVFSAAGDPSNSQYINIWGNGPGSYTYFNNYSPNPFPEVSGAVSFTVTSLGVLATAPEPASSISVSMGVLSILGYVFVRRRKRAVA